MEGKMTPEEFLQQLNPHSKVFDLSVDYKYTEEQLVLFAKLYHESELKKLRVGDVSGRSELLVCVCKNRKDQFKRGNFWICGDCEKEIKQTNCH